MDFVIVSAALLFSGWRCYRFGYKRAEKHYWSLIDQIQHPPGCTCIKNALGASVTCPHHRHLSEFSNAS